MLCFILNSSYTMLNYRT